MPPPVSIFSGKSGGGELMQNISLQGIKTTTRKTCLDNKMTDDTWSGVGFGEVGPDKMTKVVTGS